MPLNEQFYKEVIEKAANYNSKLLNDRKLRLPFLDSQTRIAQNNCHIWLTPKQRFHGNNCSQVYSYPGRRWKKKKRNSSWNDMKVIKTYNSGLNDSDIHTITTVENPAVLCADFRGDRDASDNKSSSSVGVSGGLSTSTSGSSNHYHHHYHTTYHPYVNDDSSLWYDEYDDIMDDTVDAGEIDDPDSDGSEYDEKYGHRAKKKRKTTSGRGKKKTGRFDDRDETGEIKPYTCDLCGARYKTRPGLSYHLTHQHVTRHGPASPPGSAIGGSNDSQPQIHNSDAEGTDASVGGDGTGKGKPSKSPSCSSSSMTYSSSGGVSMSGGSVVVSSSAASLGVPSQQGAEGGGGGRARFDSNSVSLDTRMRGDKRAPAHPSPYCDFCMGDSVINKKTGKPEGLVSCGDCGRSGHPSCLQFTDNMIVSVKKYSWQCIECKSCGLCGTSDNDDQLLFCDDCDRGYHMYCLNPPLDEPPEGSWSCHLCIKEFGQMASIHQQPTDRTEENDDAMPRDGKALLQSTSAASTTIAN